MKIAVATRAIAPLHGHGGLERAVGDGCAALAARGHEVTVFTASPTRTLPPSPLPFTVVAVPWQGVLPLRRGGVLDRATHYAPFTRRLTRAIRATGETYDVAIGHGAAAAAFLDPRIHGTVRALLVNPHGMEEFFAPPLKQAFLRGQRTLVRNAAAVADRVIATDTALVPAVRQMLTLTDARIAVIPNGVNLAAIDAPSPRETSSEASPLLVSVGRIEANKGLDILVAALGSITQGLPADWRWLHVGDGNGRRRLEMAIRAADIRAHVSLCGALPDAELHALLNRATLFVHPARYEGSSLVTLEAMAHRLPVVATAVGGIPDKVSPGETGWLVPPNDIRALAAALQEAVSLSDTARQVMGSRGRQRVEDNFSLDHTTDLLLACIASVHTKGESTRAHRDSGATIL